jgi:hypothetical protein
MRRLQDNCNGADWKENRGLRIADCGLRVEEILQFTFSAFAISEFRLRFKKSAIRNPQSAILSVAFEFQTP